MILTVGGVNAQMDAIKSIREKGLGNRIEHAGARFVNYEKTNLKDALFTTAGVAASVGTAALIAKSPTVQNLITKGATKLAGTSFAKTAIGELSKAASTVTPWITKAASWLKALPTAGKIALGVGLLATAIGSRIIRNKGIKEAGKIEQKYDDMAALNKRLS